MKTYFAASIRGGSEDRDIYLRIIEFLGQYGEVLTEHTSNTMFGEAGDERVKDRDVYNRDVQWLEESDVVIAEITQPSLGVGYELGRAEHLRKPIFCLYRTIPDREISPIITGNQNLRIHPYGSLDDAFDILKSFFGELGIDNA